MPEGDSIHRLARRLQALMGRRRVRVRRGADWGGAPWLILRSRDVEAAQWNGPVLERGGSVRDALGPDILVDPPDLAGMVARLRRVPELEASEVRIPARNTPGVDAFKAWAISRTGEVCAARASFPS